MKIILFHPASGESKQVDEKEVRTICSDMIANQEMDTIGDDQPVASPEDDLYHIIKCINECSSSISLELQEESEHPARPHGNSGCDGLDFDYSMNY